MTRAFTLFATLTTLSLLGACGDAPVEAGEADTDQLKYTVSGATNMALLCKHRLDPDCKEYLLERGDDGQFAEDTDGLGFWPTPELFDGVLLAAVANGGKYEVEVLADKQFAGFKHNTEYEPLATITADGEIAAMRTWDVNADGVDDLVFTTDVGTVWAALGPVIGHFEADDDAEYIIDKYVYDGKWSGEDYRQ